MTAADQVSRFRRLNRGGGNDDHFSHSGVIITWVISWLAHLSSAAIPCCNRIPEDFRTGPIPLFDLEKMRKESRLKKAKN